MKGRRFITEAQEARLDYVHTLNDSNVSIVCRIRKPTQLELYGPSPVARCAPARRNLGHNRSLSSGHPSPLRSVSSSPSSRVISPKSSLLSSFHYSVFTSANPSDLVVACENPLQGRVISDSFANAADLNFFCDKRVSEGFLYKFDRVFSDTAKQERVYAETVQDLVKDMVDGRSASVILFGPSASGKSYTLRGTSLPAGPHRGLLQRAVEQLFDYLGAANAKTQLDYAPEAPRLSLRVSMFLVDEKDKLTDLLIPPAETQKTAPRTVERKIKKIGDFAALLKDALRSRKILLPKQRLNRVHSVFSLNLYCRRADGPRRSERLSRIDFVELCSSEYAASFTHNNLTGRAVEELRHFAAESFNSLSSALIRCASGSEAQSVKEQSLVRHLLADTLGPNHRTLFICTVGPAPQSFVHSLPALKFSVQIRDAIARTRPLRIDSPSDVPRESMLGASQSQTELEQRDTAEQSPSTGTGGSSGARQRTNLLRETVLNYSTFGKSGREFELWAAEREKEIRALRERVEVEGDSLQLKNCYDELGLLLRQIDIMRGSFSPDHQPAPLQISFRSPREETLTLSTARPPRGGVGDLKSSARKGKGTGTTVKPVERLGLELEGVREIAPEEARINIGEWEEGASYSSFVKLKEKFEKASSKAKEFKTTLQDFVEKCHSLENEVEAKESVIAQYEALFQQNQQCHERGIQELEARNAQLARALRESEQQLTARHSEAESKLAQLHERIRDQERLLAETQTSVANLQSEKETVSAQLNQERQERRELLQNMESIRAQHSEANRREESQRAQETSDLRQALRCLREEAEVKTVGQERAREEAVDLKYRLKEAELRAQHAQEARTKLEAEVGDLRRKTEAQTLRLAQSDKLAELAQLELRQTKEALVLQADSAAELRERMAASGQDIKLLGAKEEARGAQIESLQREASNLRLERADLERKVKDNEITKVALETKCSEGEKQLERTELALKEAEQEVGFLRRQVEPLKLRENENIALLKRCAELETQLAIFENDKRSFTQLIERLERERRELEGESGENREERARLERELSFMSRQQHADLEQIDRRVEQVQGRLGTVQEENSKLKEQERALQRQLKVEQEKGEALMDRVADLESTVLRSRREMTELRMSSENFDRSNFPGGLTLEEAGGQTEPGDDRRQQKLRLVEDMREMVTRYREEKIQRKHTLPPTFLEAEGGGGGGPSSHHY